MASSVVSIAIRARNLIGGAVSQATSQVDNFVGAVDRTNQKFRQQRTETGQQMSSLFGLNTAFLVLGATIGSVAIAYDKLKDAAGDAAKLQIERVGAINTGMETLGLTTQQAGRYYQGVEKRIAQLGRDLPVSVEQIQQIYRTINDDFTGQLRPRGASAQQLADLSVGASARLAILAQQGNVSTGNALANISSFLGGAGIGELRQQTLFQNNPRFFNAIKENLERYGEENRAEVLSRALEQVVTDQQIRALQGTVTAQLSGFMDKLFDPTIGVFSLSRDLDEKMEGYQSVFEEFGTTLDILIGENGIIDAIGELTGIVNIDPMLIVRDGVRSLNEFLFGVSNFLNQVQGLSPEEIGEIVGRGAANFVDSLMGITLNAIRSIDLGTILSFVGAFLRGLGVGLVSFFANLDLTTYASLLLSPFTVVLAENLVGMVQEVGDKIKSVFRVVIDALSFINPTVGLVRNVTGAVTGAASPLSGAVDFVGNTASNIFNAVTKFFTGAGGFIPANSGLFDALTTEAQRKPKGTDFVVANSSEYVLTSQQMNGLLSSRSSESKTINVGGINISLNLSGGTPQEIAVEAIAILEERLNNELETIIA
ncbi:MAG: hypothetical protein AAFR83_00265 [Cyanobacteria bacterium J06629_18]